MREVKANQVYKHFKGWNVIIICVGKDSETMEELVIYKHEDQDEIWVRKMDMFLSEVDHEKYPDIKQQYRFELVKDA